MARTAIPLYVTNQLITAAHANTYWRDNEAAHWPYTTQGDLPYASSATVLSRLGIGTAGQVLKVNSGATAPEWGSGGMTLIEEKLATGDVASFDFTSIPAIYTHLKIIYAIRGDYAGENLTLRMRFNNDSGANYTYVYITTVGGGTSVSGYGNNAKTAFERVAHINGDTIAAGAVGAGTINIMNYAKTTLHKGMNSFGGADDSTENDMLLNMTYGLWKSTVAINQVTLYPGANNFVAGSIASLYGVA